VAWRQGATVTLIHLRPATLHASSQLLSSNEIPDLDYDTNCPGLCFHSLKISKVHYVSASDYVPSNALVLIFYLFAFFFF
jgi:hypothetical protein